MKPFALVRDPVHIFKSLSISQKKFTQSELMQHQKTWIHRDSNIREVLSDLRRGKTNLIFATCKSLLISLRIRYNRPSILYTHDSFPSTLH